MVGSVETRCQNIRVRKLETQISTALREIQYLRENVDNFHGHKNLSDSLDDEAQSLGSFIKKFFVETTMHGTKYIVEGSGIVERFVWTLVVLGALIYSGYVVDGSVKEYEINPVVTTYESTEINQVFFPAITVDGGSVLNHWGLPRALLDPLSDDDSGTLNKRLEPLKVTLFRRIYPKILKHVESVLGRNITINTIRDLSNNRESRGGIPALTPIFYHSNFRSFFQGTIPIALTSGYEDDNLLTYLSAMLLDFPTQTTEFLAHEFEPFVAKSIIHLGSGSGYVWSVQNSVHGVLLEHVTNKWHPTQSSLKACTNGSEICQEPLNKVGARLIALAIFLFDKYPYTEFGHFLERYYEFVFKMPLMWGQHKQLTESFLNIQTRHKRSRPPRVEIEPELEFYPTHLEEQIVSDILTEASRRFFKNMELNISLYEVSQVLDLPYLANTAQMYQAKDVYQRMNCYNFDYLVKFNTSKCGLNQNPEISGCCRIWEAISNQHENVLKMMRFNQQVPHWNTEDRLMFEEAKKGYFGAFEATVEPYGAINPRIFGCQWLGFPSEDQIFSCNLFHRLFTNAGIGYTFNSADFEDVFVDTPFMKIFDRTMNPKRKSHGKPIVSVDGPGPKHTLKIYLELNRQLDNYIKFGNPQYSWSGGIPKSPFRSLDKSFKIGIHHSNSLADLRNDYIKVKAGFEYQVLITPQVHTAEESLRSMSIEKRKCQFQDETFNSSIFKSYSQTSCQLECQLKMAVQECDCLPWNYPHLVLNGQLTKLCDYRGNYCVEQFLQKPISWQECGCYPLCEAVTYPYSLNMKVMERPCSSEYQSAVPIEYVKDSELSPFVSYPVDDYFSGQNRSYSDLTIGKEEFCKERADRSAVVEFQIVGTSVTVVKKSARTTFIGALANLGGLVALFTGMSILSLFEMIFWMWKYVRGTCF